MAYSVQDAEMIKTKALPAADAAASTDGLDLGAMTSRGSRLTPMEFQLTVPAVPDLVDDKTIIYDVQTDNDVAFGSPKTVIDNIATSTGADSAGAAAVSERFRPATDWERYVRVVATVLVGGGDNTGVDMTLKALF